MTIGILIYSLGGGGAERVVSYLLDYFHTSKVNVALVLMNQKIVYDIPKDIPVFYIEKSKSNESGLIKLFKVPFLAYKYARLCKKEKITHSLSLMTRPNYINTLSGYFNRSSKIIISERAYPSFQYGYGDLKSRINKLLIKKIFKRAHGVIANSKGNCNDLIENFNVPKDIIRVIYNPIALARIEESSAIKDYFDPTYINLITVGRLDQGKNHKLLIDAIKNLDKVRLYILGNGELQEELERQIKELDLQNNVFLLGFVENPFEFLKASDIFVFSSNHEGFPNVLLEALACGLPIISTNCKAGPSEILEVSDERSNAIMHSKYGFLVPVGNTKCMTEAILKLTSNNQFRSQFENIAKKRAAQFELRTILKKYEAYIFNH
ncbi:glycosyltransferase [Flagellimonas hymeniacidonis]|uniref:Glycosyltransferase n=1 Tax=Flagellimonas hymeniacidonis TaxID=2603628 RepID=A0A5C8V645_9FLAO|nr:glycosyltransferase [Flagellimonas hymeniacidonis]TXN35977.1 glycosyltransferase [Flagellimonas hymeniacidonis]